MELLEIEVARLRPNDYNFNEMPEAQRKKLAEEVKRRGFIMHHIVARKDGDEYVIVDGEHQWRAAQEAGFPTVPVQVVEISHAEAIAESYRRNGLHGEANRVKLGRAIRTMQQEMADAEGKPLSNKRTAAQVGKSDVWVKTTLNYAVLADLTNGHPEFPSEERIAKLTEAEMQQWLDFVQGRGPNPDGEQQQPFMLDGQPLGGGALLDGGPAEPGEQPQGKLELTEDEKIAKTLEGIIKKLRKLSPADRAHITKAITRLNREDAKAKDAEAAE